MKKPKLKKSPVRFYEEPHIYKLGDKELSGITGFINDYIFHKEYKSDIESVQKKMDAKREFGSMIHKQLEDYVNKYKTPVRREAFIETCHNLTKEALGVLNDNGIVPLVGEYLVSNETTLATKIDLVSKNFDLIDYKTYKPDSEYLRWQLSICAYLFELQNPEIKVGKLYGLIMIEGKSELVEVARLKDEYVEDIIAAFEDGAHEFENPLNSLGCEQDVLMKEYMDLDSDISILEKELEEPKGRIKIIEAEMSDKVARLKKLDGQKSQLRATIVDRMRLVDTYSVKSPTYTISRNADKVSYEFDVQSFREQYPKLYEKFLKEVRKDGTLRVISKF